MQKNVELNISKTFLCDAKTLFEAISQGAIIMETGALPEKTTIDFREGGKYSAAWESCEATTGEFLKINPYSQIVFSWNKRPDTTNAFESRVTLDFHEHDGKTKMNLKHEGLPSEEELKSHTEGWEHTLDNIYRKL